MIEDDFDKMFRRMMEQLFGAFGSPERGRSQFGFRTFSPLNELKQQGMKQEQHERDLPRVERFDFGDHYVGVVDGFACEDNLEIIVKGKRMHLKQGGPIGKTLDLEIPFVVDSEKSMVSHRNGITEITLYPEESTVTDTEPTEKTLRIT